MVRANTLASLGILAPMKMLFNVVVGTLLRYLVGPVICQTFQAGLTGDAVVEFHIKGDLGRSLFWGAALFCFGSRT